MKIALMPTRQRKNDGRSRRLAQLSRPRLQQGAPGARVPRRGLGPGEPL